MDLFDYKAPAELFYPLRMGKRSPLGFHRFDTSADAIKYALEELSPVMLQGAILEVADERFDSSLIRELYESGSFPLERSDVKVEVVKMDAAATVTRR